MQSNTCMHDCLASPTKSNEPSLWLIDDFSSWMFFYFASSCSPTTMLAARSLALSALLRRMLRSVAILWRWEARVRCFVVVLPCFTFSTKLINRSNYLMKIKMKICGWSFSQSTCFRFYVELCHLEMHVVLSCLAVRTHRCPSQPPGFLRACILPRQPCLART